MDGYWLWILAGLAAASVVSLGGWLGWRARRRARVRRQAARDHAEAAARVAEAQRIAAEAAAREQALIKAAAQAAARAEAARRVEAEAARAEAARREAVEAALADATRRSHEEAARVAAARAAAREAARAEAARVATEQAEAAQAARLAGEAEERAYAARRAAADAAARVEAERRAARPTVAPVSTLAPAQAAVQASAPVPAAPQPKVAAKPVEQILVMVADDSKVVRVKTGRLLAQHRYQVSYASDGLDAAQQMQARVPDVVITDVEMPGMDGFELTRQVRADPRTAHVPVIMITAADDRHREEADRAGVTVLLGKPYPEDELIAHIRAAVVHAAAPAGALA